MWPGACRLPPHLLLSLHESRLTLGLSCKPRIPSLRALRYCSLSLEHSVPCCTRGSWPHFIRPLLTCHLVGDGRSCLRVSPALEQCLPCGSYLGSLCRNHEEALARDSQTWRECSRRTEALEMEVRSDGWVCPPPLHMRSASGQVLNCSKRVFPYQVSAVMPGVWAC